MFAPQRARRRLEHLFWAVSLLCGATYVGARALDTWGHEAALAEFGATLANRQVSPAPSSVLRSVAPPHSLSVESVTSEAHPQAPDDVVPDTRLWSPSRIDELQRLGVQRDAMRGPAIAVLHVARLGLRVPVFPDASEPSLNRGAGLVVDPHAPAESQNLAIAAHRDSWFRSLKDIEVGDRIELQDLSTTHTYRVSALSVVDPFDLSPLAPTALPSLTLITCYPFYFVGNAPQRFIVRATADP
jgi:sortase A